MSAAHAAPCAARVETPLATSAAQVETPLALLTYFFNDLEEQRVRYCHWKSTHGLARALRGKTDLDLLVDRAQARVFRNVLSICDFRPVVSHARRQFPAIEDYLGFDTHTGQLTHLHIHYQLVLGEEFVKNYCLPMERAFLENTRILCGVRVPIPELELIVLALRMALKYRDRDVLKDVVHVGAGGFSKTALDEFRALRAQTTDERILCALEKYMPFLSPEWMMDFMSTLHRAPRSGAALFGLRRRARAELAPYRRLSPLRATRTYWNAILQQTPPFSYLGTNAERRKVPAGGGLILSFVGADGAGKSTVVQELARWCGWRLNVRKFYMGTTRPSMTTKLVKRVSEFAAAPHAATRRIFGKGNRVTRWTASVEQIATALRFLSEGRDRYNRYCAGRGGAARGNIVIFDRYPLQNARLFGRGMDGPRIATLDSKPRGVMKTLARAEETLYRKILPPEHLFVLQVSPEVSQARKPEHDLEKIQAKSSALLELGAMDGNVIAIDADQPLDDVLLQIKTHVWNLL